MKRIASILVAISLLFGLVGCNCVVDTTPPTTPGNITKTTPDNDNTPTFTWDAATDATSDIASYQVRTDSEAFTDIGNVTTYTVITALPDGAHTLEVRAVDEASNQGTAGSLTFTIDTTAAISLATLTVHFIDIGQGDSILVDFADIEVLIDGGERSPGVVSYIDDYVDGPLEVVVATHPHADHIGGLIDVLTAFEVQEIWLNGDTSTSKTYSQFMSAVDSEGAQVYEARKGDTIEVGDLVFDVLHPVNLGDTTNNNSIVLSLSYGEIDFLFTGDAEQQAESSMLRTGIVPDVEILKVGHHGSRTASSQAFLAAVQPDVAIYMAGLGNQYGHPHAETIGSLEEIGAEIYGTAVHGTIIVTSDGKTYSVQPKNDKPPVVPSITVTHNLTISVNGQGTTNPSPSTYTYDEGTQVTITASHASGWEFDHWGGDASGTLPTVVITMECNKDVTAYFKRVTDVGVGSNVRITYIFYDGLVYRVESDEYVEITNLGDTPQDLEGWVLKDISEGYPSLTFPSYVLAPGESIRVYTNEVHPEWGGFSFGYGKAIWNNKAPDTAVLYNDQGKEVSRKSY